jgi:hypothetical protein
VKTDPVTGVVWRRESMDRRQAGLVVYKKGVKKVGEGVVEIQVSEHGLLTFLTPSQQSVLCTKEGIFIPPDDILPLDPICERSFLLFYRNIGEDNFNIVVTKRKKKEGGGEDWDAVFIRNARVDGCDMVVGYGGDVFPFSVPLIALRKAIKEYDIYTIRYVLENVKETVLVK